jgi:hypothetical protein
MDAKIEMLRHTLATIAYRAGKALRGVPPEFGNFDGASRTPADILAHMGDLFDWALTLANGNQSWHNSKPLPWDQEVARFFAAVEAFDRRLAGHEPLSETPEKLFQGPIADALTHTGQIAMLRRLAGYKMSGENYHVADIAVGRVGLEQAVPRREF